MRFKGIVAIVTVVIILVLWALTFLLFLNCDANWRGTFGDMFGAVNALFSGLAFAGLIITLIMQHEELKLQRKELAQTNKELQNQRKEFSQQNKTLKVQQFENTLFNMLSLQQEITNSLHYVEKDGADYVEATGRRTFDLFYNRVVMQFGDMSRNDDIWGVKRLIEAENDVRAYHHAREIKFFDHYFRHLYRIFKYINESHLIEESNRYEYAAIVRSQLSEYELLMLFYNALNVEDDGRYKFKELIEKYSLLNNIRKEELARPVEDYKLYNGSAYLHQV